MLEYIKFLEEKHRTILERLQKEGKTYRSHSVSFERGYLIALRDIEDAINQPAKNAELQEVMKEFSKRFKG